MATLIFDILTIGEEWDTIDIPTRQILTRWIDRVSKNAGERATLETEMKDGLRFSPCTGIIVAIGLYDLERKQGVVYFQGENGMADIDAGAFVLKSRSEKEMLEDFWDGAREYDTFVTCRGRNFHIPFLNIRAAIHGVKPTQELLEGRYLYQQKSCMHIDLQEQMTYYNALRRKPSLHLLCRAFGITVPNVAGNNDNLTEFFNTKKFREIAYQNLENVVAVTELYKKWLEYLAPRSFTERFENF